jgi:hypothetical protein
VSHAPSPRLVCRSPIRHPPRQERPGRCGGVCRWFGLRGTAPALGAGGDQEEKASGRWRTRSPERLNSRRPTRGKWPVGCSLDGANPSAKSSRPRHFGENSEKVLLLACCRQEVSPAQRLAPEPFAGEHESADRGRARALPPREVQARALREGGGRGAAADAGTRRECRALLAARR